MRALEAKSEHPLAKAIVEEGKSKKFDQTSLQADEFSALPGNGLEGTVMDIISWWKCFLYHWKNRCQCFG